MNPASEKEVLAVFELLGLGTEKERAEFNRFPPACPFDDCGEFIYLDNSTQAPEVEHAELA